MRPLAALGACAVVLAGCGSNTEKITIPSPDEAAATKALPTASTQTETTGSAPEASSSHTLAHFNEGPWPFTAQIASVTENPNGFPGGGMVPPEGYTVLMVQVNITSEVTGRTVPVPYLKLHCAIPGVQFGQEGEYGYDGGEEAPAFDGPKIAFGDGQPHPWDGEWEVPEGTSTSKLSCELEVGVAGTKDYTTLHLT